MRNRQNGLYYQRENQWTPERSRASDLGEPKWAIKLAVDSSLDDVDAVLDFDDPQCDIVLPITKSRPAS